MNKNTKNIIVILGTVLFIAFLIIWGRSSTDTATAGYWPGTDIECLPSGHQSLALHIHPVLSINVNGEEEAIPGNIGISGNCMAEVHTHEPNGVLHLESVHQGKEFVLGDFFKVWGEPLEREEFQLAMTVDGEESNELGDLVLKDHQQIVLEYSSVGEDNVNDGEEVEEDAEETEEVSN